MATSNTFSMSGQRGGLLDPRSYPGFVEYLRSALRLRFEPERGYDHIGFRVVVVMP